MSIRKFIFDNHVLTGIYTPLFPYEILLPAEYYIIYGGFEKYGNKYRNCDFNYRIIESEEFAGMITVVNLNPKSIPIICTDPDYYVDLDEEAIDLYKRICINGFFTQISFNKDNEIEIVCTSYIMELLDNSFCQFERISVDRSKDPIKNRMAQFKY